MIEIRTVAEPALAKRLCRENGVTWRPEYRVIAAWEGERALHCAVFSYHNDTGEIYAIAGFDGDLSLLDGLCRAILNIMDINGVKTAFLSDQYPEIARQVGFKKIDGRFQLSLENFFCCSCKEREKK